ncbi:hypothetical protein AAG906_008019 [Vitis piasezkii]
MIRDTEQKELDESFFTKEGSKTYAADDSMKLQHSLFDRLFPLLVIRLLPMRVFNELDSSVIYGQLLDQVVMHGYGPVDINDHVCVAMQLETEGSSTHAVGLDHRKTMVPTLCTAEIEGVLEYVDTPRRRRASGDVL